MQIIKDLVLGLKAKIPLLPFITQQYSSNKLFDFFSPYHKKDLLRNSLDSLHTFPNTV